jgi:hypothetical protein
MAAQNYVQHLKLSDKDDWESNPADVRSGGGAAADLGLEAHGGEEGVAREHSVDSLGKYLTDRGVIDDAKSDNESLYNSLELDQSRSRSHIWKIQTLKKPSYLSMRKMK